MAQGRVPRLIAPQRLALVRSPAMAEPREHALVLYRPSATADAALEFLSEREARMTVVVLAREETRRHGCCDTRSVLWNRISRDLAREDLSRAADALGDNERVEFRGAWCTRIRPRRRHRE